MSRRRHRRVALATCAALPDLDPDERTLIPALDREDVVAVPAVWDDPGVDWRDHDLVVIRSTWDYADRRDEYLEWCASLPHVCNPHPVVAWNTDKTYLRDLTAAGIPVVPTTWVEPGAATAEIALPAGDFVVKPAISAGARNTARYRPKDASDARAHVARLLDAGRTVMVQPYVRSVDRDGETGLIHVDGVLSHCIRKGPLLTEPGRTTRGLWEPETISAREPDAAERSLAERTLDALPWARGSLLYARVDTVRGDDGALLVLELELAEPSLFLGLGSGAAERLAGAIVARLDRM